MKVRCLYDELLALDKFKSHPKNPNKHPSDQIERLAQILDYQGARYPAKVSRLSGYVTAGHGRILAAKRLGWDSYPVNYQEYESEEQEYADVVADNSIAAWSELDLSAINVEIANLGPDFDIDLLGIKEFTLDPSEKAGEDGDDRYTKKIEAPIYTPKGEKPDVRELFDAAKANELTKEIEESELPIEIKGFLKLAAQRHTVFDYEKIAEYYAHAPKELQELMEKSALVIIDFNAAIENGFVTMTKEISEVYLA